jgi:hypothetical protein
LKRAFKASINHKKYGNFNTYFSIIEFFENMADKKKNQGTEPVVIVPPDGEFLNP